MTGNGAKLTLVMSPTAEAPICARAMAFRFAPSRGPVGWPIAPCKATKLLGEHPVFQRLSAPFCQRLSVRPRKVLSSAIGIVSTHFTPRKYPVPQIPIPSVPQIPRAKTANVGQRTDCGALSQIGYAVPENAENASFVKFDNFGSFSGLAARRAGVVPNKSFVSRR